MISDLKSIIKKRICSFLKLKKKVNIFIWRKTFLNSFTDQTIKLTIRAYQTIVDKA